MVIRSGNSDGTLVRKSAHEHVDDRELYHGVAADVSLHSSGRHLTVQEASVY